jgi:NitT/TauT family transport system substrate-binding protein
MAIMVHEDDPIKSLKDLNDRTVMAAPEQDWIQYLRLHYHIEFRLIPLNYGVGGFMADKHFVQQCFVTNEPYFVRKNGGHARTLLVSDSGYDPYRCLLATRHFVEEHPRAVRAFVAASIKGWKDFMSGDPEPALKMILSRNPQNTRDLMQFSVQAMRDQHIVAGSPELGEQVGLMTRRRLEAEARLLSDIGITRSDLSVDKFATFDFQPEDLRAIGLR